MSTVSAIYSAVLPLSLMIFFRKKAERKRLLEGGEVIPGEEVAEHSQVFLIAHILGLNCYSHPIHQIFKDNPLKIFEPRMQS